VSSCGSNADMETPAPLVDGTVNNAAFYSSLHINQTLHLFTSCIFVWYTRCSGLEWFQG